MDIPTREIFCSIFVFSTRYLSLDVGVCVVVFLFIFLWCSTDS